MGNVIVLAIVVTGFFVFLFNFEYSLYIPVDIDPLYRDTDPPKKVFDSGILTPPKNTIFAEKRLIPGY
jgi:hypothetical protein